jgi:hypothetical protein
MLVTQLNEKGYRAVKLYLHGLRLRRVGIQENKLHFSLVLSLWCFFALTFCPIIA